MTYYLYMMTYSRHCTETPVYKTVEEFSAVSDVDALRVASDLLKEKKIDLDVTCVDECKVLKSILEIHL